MISRLLAQHALPIITITHTHITRIHDGDGDEIFAIVKMVITKLTMASHGLVIMMIMMRAEHGAAS